MTALITCLILNFIDRNYTGLSSFGELIIDHCQYAFHPWFDVLEKINLYKLISPLINRKIFFTELC